MEKVLKEYPDGRMDLITVGRRRFEIILLNDEKPYLRGAVQYFDDDATDPISPEARKRVIDSYNDLRALEDSEPVLEAPESPETEEAVAPPVVAAAFHARATSPFRSRPSTES